MIQAGLQTSKGPIGLIGINYENLRRMKAGMPLDIDLKKITPPGTKITQVIIHYGHTYEDVVKDWEEGHIPVTDAVREEAKRMDQKLADEKR